MAKKTRKTTASEAVETAKEAETIAPADDQSPKNVTPEAAQDALGGGGTDAATTETGSQAGSFETEPGEHPDAEASAEAAEATDAVDTIDAASEAETPTETHTETSDDVAEVTAEDTPGSDIDADQTDPINSEATDAEPSDTELADTDGSATEARDDGLASDTPETKVDALPDDIEPDAKPDTGPAAAPVAPPSQAVERKGGFVPMLLGGVVAAALGYGAADYAQPGGFLGGTPVVEEDPFEAETRVALESATARLAALENSAPAVDPAAVAALESGLSDAASQLETLSSGLAEVSGKQESLTEQLTAFDARLTEVAQAPLADNVSDAAIAAYEAAIDGYENDLVALQESVAAQRAEIEDLAAVATAREAEARALAESAQVQTAAAALIVQVESGDPFSEMLENYLAAGGDDVAPALSDLAGEGVPSLASLQESFPDAARAALVAVRNPAADTSDGAGGLGTFLARQLQVRSVAPREGDDPDAVLSRAEAAVRSGDLGAALSEIETLPEAARSELADWEATARLRRDAMAAATALSASVNSN